MPHSFYTPQVGSTNSYIANRRMCHKMRKAKEYSTRNVLAIARREKNKEDWLAGEFFGLASTNTYLQDIVGDGGTLWIVVSSKKPDGGGSYSISFQLQGCRPVTYNSEKTFRKHTVVGDPNRSTIYEANDSKLLLMSLRFKPQKPISDVYKIGKSIQTPRCLSHEDVELIKNHISDVDRWSVFLTYKRDDESVANKLSNSLRRLGINIFQDHKSIPAGKQWKMVILNAVKRARSLIILIGANTHNSFWVKEEVKYAIANDVYVIPVLVGGRLENWSEMPELSQKQAINNKGKKWSEFVEQVAKSLPPVYA